MGISCCESLKHFLDEEKQTQFDKKAPKPIKKMGKKELSDNLKEEKYEKKIKNTDNGFFGNFGVDKDKNDILQSPAQLKKDLNINEINNISSNFEKINKDDIIITTNNNLITDNGKEEINININNEVTPQNDNENDIKLKANKKEEKGETNEIENKNVEKKEEIKIEEKKEEIKIEEPKGEEKKEEEKKEEVNKEEEQKKEENKIEEKK